uniref:Zinc finger CCCH domain-containing protein 14 n=1 Tax=Phallusia mammillata TaxID=59560 RepID=A0A6F9DY33_9ASCI|nr:zinc finger CCCH domain-containing protein 14-like [Phallusia mammillata]
MEIGTDISKNIQQAIKAKLVELNSYVDDELPDYIMIMIANRKKEEQMTDSLSLFLGNNTKVFTKWLFELLSGLREKQQTDNVKKEVPVKEKKQVDHTEEKKENKLSRWDVKGQETDVTEAKIERKNSEAVIDILPEAGDVLDLELYGSNDLSSDVAKTSQKAKTSSATGKTDSKRSVDHEKDVNKDKATTSQDTDNQSDLKRSSGKKMQQSKGSSRKEKSKKLKRSKSSREEGTTSKRSHSTSNKIVRDWDKSKADQNEWREDLNFNTQSKKRPSRKISEKDRNDVDEDYDDEPVVKKVSSSVVQSSVSSVNRGYVSEESDNETQKSSVVSKVALPERRSRLPPSKQANRSLLLKAVCEAETSVKQSHAISSSADIKHATKSVKSRLGKVENKAKYSHESTSKTKSTKSFKTDDVVLKKKILVLKRKSADAQHKETNVEKPKKLKSKPDNDVPVSSSKKQGKNHHDKQSNEEDESCDYKSDKRRFVSRSSSDLPVVVSKHGSVVRDSPNNSSSVKFDQRNLRIKKTEDENDRDGEISLSESESLIDEPGTSKNSRSPSPCFIVTLDGNVQKDKNSVSKPSLISNQPAKPKFKAIPITAPGNSNASTSAEKQTSSDKKSEQPPETVSDDELSSMRAKLLKMQEEAKKLKTLQQEQLAAIKQTSAVVKAVTTAPAKPDLSKSIHVANVHFSATEKQLSGHFGICGKVKRVTILKDSFTGHPKGFAYLEFEEQSSVESALALDNTTFCNRAIRVTRKTSVTPTQPAFSKPAPFSFRNRPPLRPRHRYSARMAIAAVRPRFRAIQGRNKTWVKPGYVPS